MLTKLFSIYFFAIGGAAIAAPKPSSLPRTVEPKAAQNLPPISLGALVYAALPRGGIQWDALQIPAVRWETSGIANKGGDVSYRTGLARVRANGTISQVLRQNWVELAWVVSLETDKPPKWGPQEIGISTADQCFGTEFKGCAFPTSALGDSRMVIKLVCEAGSAGFYYRVFQAVARDGRVATVSHITNSGSGGETNAIKISTKKPKEVCSDINRLYPS